MGGRPRKPSAVHEASGAYRKDPQRRNQYEPKAPEGWPERPDWMDGDDVAAHCWQRTCELLDEMGLISKADEHAIEGYCSDYSQWRFLRDECKLGNIADVHQTGRRSTPEVTQLHRYQDRMHKFWTEYGLTPASRSKLIAKQAGEDEDPMKELLARMRPGAN